MDFLDLIHLHCPNCECRARMRSFGWLGRYDQGHILLKCPRCKSTLNYDWLVGKTLFFDQETCGEKQRDQKISKTFYVRMAGITMACSVWGGWNLICQRFMLGLLLITVNILILWIAKILYRKSLLGW